jgi:hypothetical protein
VNREGLVLDEDGEVVQPIQLNGVNHPAGPSENGWKDSVIAYPGQVTRLRLRFTNPGQFVWHCHIVEHEDNEMMRPYRIGPVQPGPAGVVPAGVNPARPMVAPAVARGRHRREGGCQSDERGCLMKALTYGGPGVRAWETVPDPAVREPTDVVVEIGSSTICGTDLHILKGDVPTVEPGHPQARGRRTVVARARRDDGRRGRRVLVSCITACGRCRFCKKPVRHVRRRRGWILRHLIDGLRRSTLAFPSPIRPCTQFPSSSRTSRCCSSPTSSRLRSRSGC